MAIVYSIHDYVIEFVSDLRQVGDFLQLFWSPPPIILTTTILYNYCTSLSAIWCVMEHRKAILTAVKGRPRSILLFSAPNIILHKMKWCNCFITFNIPSFFCMYLDQFLGIAFFSNSKPHKLIQLISYSVYKFIWLIQCVQTYITNSISANLYLHSACVCKASVPLSVCLCDVIATEVENVWLVNLKILPGFRPLLNRSFNMKSCRAIWRFITKNELHGFIILYKTINVIKLKYCWKWR